MKEQHIGMFDSGIGGLTVMQEMIKTLPFENMIYFGDTARVPYGEKSRETIIRYSIENAIFLMEKNIKVLVVACNTANAHALEKLQQLFNIPIIGVIQPGAKKAAETTKNQRIAILATKGTIHSKSYENAILKHLPGATLFPIACPLFVPLVEEQLLNHDATKMMVKEYLRPLKNQAIDTVLLGCTHYPLLYPLIQEEMGPGVHIIDSAKSCAEATAELLVERQLQTSKGERGRYHYFVSDDPEVFLTKSRGILGNNSVLHVEKT